MFNLHRNQNLKHFVIELGITIVLFVAIYSFFIKIMYSCSTQRKSWTFTDESELQKLRDEANRKYVSAHKMKESKMLSLFPFCKYFMAPPPDLYDEAKEVSVVMDVPVYLENQLTISAGIAHADYQISTNSMDCVLADTSNIKREFMLSTKTGEESVFLSSAEERVLLLHYQLQLRDFCRKFQPSMPRAVAGTAFNYFKRFYLNNSVMDYHPKEILVTCVFLACKVEEFNVSIYQFVSNIKGDREKASDIIINNEMLLMRHLHYQLTVHNPFRAVEGALIDIKTRSQLVNAERLRPSVEDALDKLFLTDACLLFSPSQIALAAILHAVSKLQENLDSFVTEILLGPTHQDYIVHIIEIIRKIRSMIKSFEAPSRDVIRSLEKRVERCRNQENNPDSQIYKERMRENYEDEDFDSYRSRPTQDADKITNEIGISSLSSNSS